MECAKGLYASAECVDAMATDESRRAICVNTSGRNKILGGYAGQSLGPVGSKIAGPFLQFVRTMNETFDKFLVVEALRDHYVDHGKSEGRICARLRSQP